MFEGVEKIGIVLDFCIVQRVKQTEITEELCLSYRFELLEGHLTSQPNYN